MTHDRKHRGTPDPNELVSAKNFKGKQLRPGGKKYFPRRRLTWLRKRKAGVDPHTIHPKPAVLRERALANAKQLRGVLEKGGNNRGPVVDKIIRANDGTPGESWCGDFVAYVYRNAGSKAVSRSWAGVRWLGRVAGTLILPDVRSAKPGDILVYDFPGGDPDSDHTGLLVHYSNGSGHRVDAKRATHVRAIEGNTGKDGAVSDSTSGGDGVHTRLRPINQVKRAVRVKR